MWKHSLVALVLLVHVVAGASAQALDLSGTYSVEGVNPGGVGRYRGEVRVVKTKETFQVLWKIGKQEYRGTGILRSGGFAVVFQPVRGQAGLATYEVLPNGALSGSWVGVGGADIGSEVWNPRDRT